jgi:hypothetical protein
MRISVSNQKNSALLQPSAGQKMPSFLSKGWSRLQQVSRHYIKSLNASQELQVWQTCDRWGNRWWSAYDPATERSIGNVSEDRIRAWVEHRYQ